MKNLSAWEVRWVWGSAEAGVGMMGMNCLIWWILMFLQDYKDYYFFSHLTMELFSDPID